MSNLPLKGTALITGASSGIGAVEALAKRLKAETGWTVKTLPAALNNKGRTRESRNHLTRRYEHQSPRLHVRVWRIPEIPPSASDGRFQLKRTQESCPSPRL